MPDSYATARFHYYTVALKRTSHEILTEMLSWLQYFAASECLSGLVLIKQKWRHLQSIDGRFDIFRLNDRQVNGAILDWSLRQVPSVVTMASARY
jgi:hypothetical protein